MVYQFENSKTSDNLNSNNSSPRKKYLLKSNNSSPRKQPLSLINPNPNKSSTIHTQIIPSNPQTNNSTFTHPIFLTSESKQLSHISVTNLLPANQINDHAVTEKNESKSPKKGKILNKLIDPTSQSD